MMLPVDRAVVNRPEGDHEGHVPDARGLEEDHGRKQARRKKDYRTALTALPSSASPKMRSYSGPLPVQHLTVFHNLQEGCGGHAQRFAGDECDRC